MLYCIKECMNAGEEYVTFRFDLNDEELINGLKEVFDKGFHQGKAEVYCFWTEEMGDYKTCPKLYYMKISWKNIFKNENKVLTSYKS